MRVIRIRALVKSRKWQIAEQMASTYPLKRSLFGDLVGEQLYLQANDVYLKYNLQGQVPPVSSEHMQEQGEREKDLYLLLPAAVLSRVVVVNDLKSLQSAADALLPSVSVATSRDDGEGGGNQHPFFIGVDAEWRAVVLHKNQNAMAGASVLQVKNRIVVATM